MQPKIFSWTSIFIIILFQSFSSVQSLHQYEGARAQYIAALCEGRVTDFRRVLHHLISDLTHESAIICESQFQRIYTDILCEGGDKVEWMESFFACLQTLGEHNSTISFSLPDVILLGYNKKKPWLEQAIASNKLVVARYVIETAHEFTERYPLLSKPFETVVHASVPKVNSAEIMLLLKEYGVFMQTITKQALHNILSDSDKTLLLFEAFGIEAVAQRIGWKKVMTLSLHHKLTKILEYCVVQGVLADDSLNAGIVNVLVQKHWQILASYCSPQELFQLFGIQDSIWFALKNQDAHSVLSLLEWSNIFKPEEAIACDFEGEEISPELWSALTAKLSLAHLIQLFGLSKCVYYCEKYEDTAIANALNDLYSFDEFE